MRARRYQDKDFEMIQKWMDDREVPRFKRSYLPKRGWIVDDVATIFLMKPDCKMGILDFFITNPKISQDVRLQACDLLIAEAEKEAVKLGMEAMSGNTKILKVQALGLRYGFKYDATPYFFFIKLLGDENERRNNVYSSRTDNAGNLDPLCETIA